MQDINKGHFKDNRVNLTDINNNLICLIFLYFINAK